jgi:hypothetical protein
MEQVLPPELQFLIVSPGSIAAVPVPAFSVADELPHSVITGNIRPHTNNSELFIAPSSTSSRHSARAIYAGFRRKVQKAQQFRTDLAGSSAAQTALQIPVDKLFDDLVGNGE